MKKSRLIMLSLCLLFLPFIYFGCDKTIKVESMNFYYDGNENSVTKIEMEKNGEQVLEIRYEPTNATNVEFEVVSCDTEYITITQDENNKCLFTLHSQNKSTKGTVVSIGLKDNKNIQAFCTVEILESYEKLPVPEGLHFNQAENRIEWFEVRDDQDEQSYTVMVNDKEYPCYENYLNFSDVNLYDQNLTVKVKTNGLYNFYDSDYSETKTFKKLSKIETVEFNNGLISFSANPNASSYILNINGESINIEQSVSDVVTFNVENSVANKSLETAGKYNISVVAVSDEENVINSDLSNVICVERLQVPQNCDVQNNILTWDGVENAINYQVVCNNIVVGSKFVINQLNTYSFKITEELLKQYNLTDCEFSVIAIGDGISTLTSAPAKFNTITKLPAVVVTLQEKEVRINDTTSIVQNVISWQGGEYGSTYSVEIDNGNEVLKFTTQNDYFVLDENFNSGAYSVKVKNLGNGSTTITSEESNTVEVVKLSCANVGTFKYDDNTQMLRFTANDATSFEVVIDGVSYSINSQDVLPEENFNNNKMGEIYLGDKIELDGTHKIVVKSKNTNYVKQDDSNFYGYIDSEYSNEYVINKLAPSQLKVENGKIKWESRANCEGYKVLVYSASSNQELIVQNELIAEILTQETTYDFANNKQIGLVALNENTTYFVEIVAVGNSNKQIMSSSASQSLKFNILSAPQVNVVSENVLVDEQFSETYKTGKLAMSILNENASSFDYFILDTQSSKLTKLSKAEYETNGYQAFLQQYANKEIMVYAVANGSLSTSDEVNYLTSANGEAKQFYQMPTISNIQFLNGQIVFDAISFNSYNANNEIEYTLKFTINDEMVKTITVSGIEENKIKYSLQQAIKEILDIRNDDLSVKYDITQSNIQIGIEVLQNTNGYSLLTNNNSSKASFTKLQTPVVSLTSAQDMIDAFTNNSFTENDVSGLLKIFKVENASNYTVLTYKNGELVGRAQSIERFASDYFTYEFDDNDINEATYTFKVIANGNGKNEITSEICELSGVKKYSAPTLEIKDGTINWTTSYNKGFFVDCLFMLEINDSLYLPYETSKFLDPLYLLSLKNVSSGYFPTNLPAGEYDITIRAIPVNATVGMSGITINATSLISSRFVVHNIVKIPAPTSSFMADGKFYFSKVEGASGYKLLVNEDEYLFDVNEDGSLKQAKENFDVAENMAGYYVFDFAKVYSKQQGDYELKVQALTNKINTVHSGYSTSVKTTVLPISQVSIVDGKVALSQVTNASSFTFTILDSSSNVVDVLELGASTKTVDFENYNSGTYTVKVVANGDGENYITNTLQTLNVKQVTKLNAPTNLSINKGDITWQNVVAENDFNKVNFSITTIGATNVIEKSIVVKKSQTVTFQLGNDFRAGNYTSIQIRALGGNEFLNSSLSSKMAIIANNNTSTKLAETTIRTESGVLIINNANYTNLSYYEMVVGSNVYNIGKVASLNLTDGEFETYEVTQDGLLQKTNIKIKLQGNNTIKIRAMGSFSLEQGWFINGDYSKVVTVEVLENVKNVKLEDGELTWVNPETTNINNLNLVYSLNGGNQRIININNLQTYHFVEVGEYEVFFINNGNTLPANQDGYILNSVKSSVIKLNKQIAPEKIESTFDAGSSQTTLFVNKLSGSKGCLFVLDDKHIVANISEADAVEKYAITIKIANDRKLVNSEYVNYNYLIINGEEFKVNGKRYELGETYSIKAKYLGESATEFKQDIVYLLNSEFSPSNSGTIPNAPELKVETTVINNQEVNTGKVMWQPVFFNNGQNIVDKYVVTVFYIPNSVEITDVQFASEQAILTIDGKEIIVSENSEIADLNVNNMQKFNSYETEKTYVYSKQAGQYIVFVKSLLTNSGSYSTVSVCEYKYDLFENGDGSQENPYEIGTMNQFNSIKFNMENNVYYKLVEDIDYAGQSYLSVGTKDNMFNANLDGNGYKVLNISINSYAYDSIGLFNTIGENGSVKNLTVENFEATQGGYFIGIIASINKGNITDCLVSGTIGSDYKIPEKNIYNGGICGYNYGKITSCSSNATIKTNASNAKSSFAGGIAGYNDANGIIVNCTNYANVGLEEFAGQIAGGIVGTNDGHISYSVNKGNVFAMTRVNSQNAFAGGIAGRNLGTMENVLNEASVMGYYISSSSATVYGGGIAGYNNGVVANAINQVNENDVTIYANGLYNSYVGSIIGYSESVNVYDVYVVNGVKLVRSGESVNLLENNVIGNGISPNNMFNKNILTDDDDITLLLNDSNWVKNDNLKYSINWSENNAN